MIWLECNLCFSRIFLNDHDMSDAIMSDDVICVTSFSIGDKHFCQELPSNSSQHRGVQLNSALA